MPDKSPRSSRTAKSRAIRRIDKAIPKEKKYQRKRKKEDKERKAARERYQQATKHANESREVEQPQWVEHHSEEEEEDKEVRTKKEESIPFECIICSEEITDILQRAVQEGKGGVDGGLVLWFCDLRDCGALFCISCAIRYITPPLPTAVQVGRTTCPGCRREWNLERLREQARAYDPTLLGEG